MADNRNSSGKPTWSRSMSTDADRTFASSEISQAYRQSNHSSVPTDEMAVGERSHAVPCKSPTVSPMTPRRNLSTKDEEVPVDDDENGASEPEMEGPAGTSITVEIPQPTTHEGPCSICRITSAGKRLVCHVCDSVWHYECLKREFNYDANKIRQRHNIWKCFTCGPKTNRKRALVRKSMLEHSDSAVPEVPHTLARDGPQHETSQPVTNVPSRKLGARSQSSSSPSDGSRDDVHQPGISSSADTSSRKRRKIVRPSNQKRQLPASGTQPREKPAQSRPLRMIYSVLSQESSELAASRGSPSTTEGLLPEMAIPIRKEAYSVHDADSPDSNATELPVKGVRKPPFDPREPIVTRSEAREDIKMLRSNISDLITQLIVSYKHPPGTLKGWSILFHESMPPWPNSSAFLLTLKKLLRIPVEERLLDHLKPSFESLDQSVVIEGLVGILVWELFDTVPTVEPPPGKVQDSLEYDSASAEAFLHDYRSRALILYRTGDRETVSNFTAAADATTSRIFEVLDPLIHKWQDHAKSRDRIATILIDVIKLAVRLKALPGSIETFWPFPGDEFEMIHHSPDDGMNNRDLAILREKGLLSEDSAKILVTTMFGVIYKKPGQADSVYAQAFVYLDYSRGSG